MVYRLLLLLFLCPFISITSINAQDEIPINPQFTPSVVISAVITGVQVVPDPSDTNIAAVAGIFLNGKRDEMVVNLYANNFSGNLTEVLIRKGRQFENGELILDLTERIEGKKINTTVNNISKELVTNLVLGNYYIEIKTDNFQGVAARGALELETDDSFVGLVNASNILDEASDSPARGIVSAHYTPFIKSLEVNFFASDLSSPITGAKLHIGDATTEDGDIAVDLMEYVTNNRIFATLDATDFAQSLINSQTYIEITTEDFPEGEVRGQLSYTNQLVHDGWLSGAQVAAPEPNSTGITGFSVFILNASFKQVDYWIFTEELEEEITEIFLRSAEPGDTSIFVYNLSRNIDEKVAIGKITNASVPLFAGAMLAGSWYVSISTEDFYEKVRGQLYRVARDGHLFTFCPDENAAVADVGDGGGLISIGRRLDHSHVVFTSYDLSSDVTSIALKKGAIGEEGEEIVDLEPVSLERFTNWYWSSDYEPKGFDAAVAEDVRSSNAFFQYATTNFPDGEIRGQVLSQLNCTNRFNESADLELDLQLSRAHYAQYDSLGFCYTVRNSGVVTAENVEVDVPLPDGFVYCYDEASRGEYDLYHQVWNVGTLAPGESAKLNILNLALSSGNNINYFTEVSNSSAFDHDSTPGNQNFNATEDDEAATTILAVENGGAGTGDFNVDLELSLSADNMNPAPYENVNYSISIINNGTDFSNNILLDVTIPPGLAYTSHSTDKGDVRLWNGEWYILGLAPGEVATLNLELFTLWPSSVIPYFVQIQAVTEPDVDSTPGNVFNFVVSEDDEARVEITTTANVGGRPSTPASFTALNRAEVYPNPAVSRDINLMLQSGTDTEGEIIIYDTTGKIISKERNTFNQGFNKFSYDISNYPVGTYFIKVPELEVTSRFIKM